MKGNPVYGNDITQVALDSSSSRPFNPEPIPPIKEDEEKDGRYDPVRWTGRPTDEIIVKWDAWEELKSASGIVPDKAVNSVVNTTNYKPSDSGVMRGIRYYGLPAPHAGVHPADTREYQGQRK